MSGPERRTMREPRTRTFDVICAGEARVSVALRDGRAEQQRVRFRPGGGAMNAALALATEGLRVGLASVLTDDSSGRSLLTKLTASGVDIDGVQMAQPTRSLVFVRGGARQVVSSREEQQPIAVPERWSSRVLLLSGMSPVVSHAAALCKAARAARRAGAAVVVDVNAMWPVWQGRDARTIRMVLREADVVWCRAEDLFALNMDVTTLRAALRPTAVSVSSDGAGRAWATGPFGEIAHSQEGSPASLPLHEGDAFTVAICEELARVGHADERGGLLWERVLKRAHAAVLELRARS